MASLMIKGGRVLSPEDNLDAILDVRIEDGADLRHWVQFARRGG